MPEAPLKFYPQYCFQLSPTINKWCPLRTANVQALTRRAEFGGQNVYFHLNHPIKWVRIAGVVVACDEYYGRFVYTIDDGSGATIECREKPEPKPNAATTVTTPAGGIDGVSDRADKASQLLGRVMLIKGELHDYRHALQVQIVRAVHLRSTEEEMNFWAKTQAFARVLARPWELDEHVMRQCRQAAGLGAVAESPKQTLGSKTKQTRESPDEPMISRAPPKRWSIVTETATIPTALRQPPPRWTLNPPAIGQAASPPP